MTTLTNPKWTIFGFELSTTLYFVLVTLVYFKFGWKYAALFFATYFIFRKDANATTVTNPNTNPSIAGGIRGGIGGGGGIGFNPNPNGGISYIGLVVDGTGSTGVDYVDFLKDIPVPNTNGEYFPHLFPDIVPPTFPDAVTGLQINTMLFGMNASVLAFKRRGIDPSKKGILDLTVDRYDNGVEIVGKYGDFPIDVNTFDSPIELQNRGVTCGWGLGAGESFDGKTMDEIWDIALSVSGASYFGLKEGAGRAMLLEMDIENGYAEGQTQNKIDAIYNLFEGSASLFKGYISSPYSSIFDSLGYLSAVVYPDENGVFPDNAPKSGVFWGTCQNGKAAGKSATNGTLSKKIIWGSEVSHAAEESAYEDGENMYAPDGTTVLRVVKRFGTNPTHEHFLARELGVNETNAFAAEQYGYRWGGYTKSVCDRSGKTGKGWDYDDCKKYHDYVVAHGESFGILHISRLKMFKTVVTKAMVGCFLQTDWDRNSFPEFALTNCDAYHGWLASIEEINFIKRFDNDNVSFSELFPHLTFLRWKTSVGFNDGVKRFVTAHDVQASKEVCTARGAVDLIRGYYVAWACKAYGVENVEKVTFDYEDNNWILEPVSLTLTTQKDYDFDIFKMTRKELIY